MSATTACSSPTRPSCRCCATTPIPSSIWSHSRAWTKTKRGRSPVLDSAERRSAKRPLISAAGKAEQREERLEDVVQVQVDAQGRADVVRLQPVPDALQVI